MTEADAQKRGVNALAAALVSTWGPLDRRPDRQVVITSGFQLHLPSAPLSHFLSGLILRTTEGRHGSSLKPPRDITEPSSKAEATDISLYRPGDIKALIAARMGGPF